MSELGIQSEMPLLRLLGWRRAVCVGMMLAALLVLFHRYSELGKALSSDAYALMWATCFAAFVGFSAVVLQARWSYRALLEQRADQHRAEEIERERQKGIIATALLAEINQFNESHTKAFRAKRGIMLAPTFSLYQANASRVGEFGRQVAQAIVDFYTLALEHAAAVHRYVQIVEGPMFPGETVQQKEEREAAFFNEHLRDKLELLKQSAEEAMRVLQQIAALPEKASNA